MQLVRLGTWVVTTQKFLEQTGKCGGHRKKCYAATPNDFVR